MIRLAGVRMASWWDAWSRRGLLDTLTCNPYAARHPRRVPRETTTRSRRRASRVVARVFSARMEQLAQFVSKSFDNASLTTEHPCRNPERPPSARITLSVAHLLGDPENDCSTFAFSCYSLGGCLDSCPRTTWTGFDLLLGL